jgi:segregation and condensation protein B
MRFGLKDVGELPSMEEFEKLVAESFQAELIPAESTAEETEVVQPAPDGGVEEPASEDVSGAEKAG